MVVVDFSGSMRRDDVPGARCRSDAVFLTLCRDFVQPQILQQQQQQQQQQQDKLLQQSSSSSSSSSSNDDLEHHHQQHHHQQQQQQQLPDQTQEETFDVVSIIVMKDQSQYVLLQAEPLDWVLYNTLIDFRENAFDTELDLKPRGHGCYLPALDLAEELLWMHHSSSNPSQQSQETIGSSCSSSSSSSRSASNGNSTTRTQINSSVVAAARNNMGDGCALSLLFFSDGKPSDPHVFKNKNNNVRNIHYNTTSTNDNAHNSNDKNQQQLQFCDGSYQAIANRVGKIAARLGRRLTLGCIAMAGSSSSSSSSSTKSNHPIGDHDTSKNAKTPNYAASSSDNDNNDFVALQQMVREAQAHGSRASFHQPRVLHSESLSQIMTTLVTSMTSTKTELSRTTYTSRKCSSSSKRNHYHHQRLTVRTDIIRERSDHWGCLSGAGASAAKSELDAKDEYLSQEWRVFRDPRPGQHQLQQHQHQLQYTVNVWTWNSRRNDWVYLMDPRCQHCFARVADETFSTTKSSSFASPFATNTTMSHVRQEQVPGRLCLSCQACYFCLDCIQRGLHLGHTTTVTRPPTWLVLAKP
jgi:hypothetical protein